VFDQFPNTEKRVENTTHSGVLLTKFEVFGNVVTLGLQCLIYLLNQNENCKEQNGEIQLYKSALVKIRYSKLSRSY